MFMKYVRLSDRQEKMMFLNQKKNSTEHQMQIETGSLDWSSQTTLKRRREDEASEEISRPGKKIGYGCHMFAERISVKEENECCAHKTCTEFCHN